MTSTREIDGRRIHIRNASESPQLRNTSGPGGEIDDDTYHHIEEELDWLELANSGHAE
jgi:hypothetical protein